MTQRSIRLVNRGRNNISPTCNFIVLSRWYFVPAGSCTDPSVSWRQMSLHTAVTGGQFCCRNGQCLPSERRCDNSIDCVDQSDEDSCQLVQYPNFQYSADKVTNITTSSIDKINSHSASVPFIHQKISSIQPG